MNYYVLKSIEFGPLVLGRIVGQINSSQWDTRPDPERFTLREMIAHLADWEPIFRTRMELILTEPGVVITGQDEGERAIANRYHEKAIEDSLRLYAKERERTTRFIRNIDRKDFELAGQRDGYGPMSIEDFANLIVCHDMYHLDQAATYLKI